MVRLQASSTIAQQVGVDTVEQSIPTPQVQQTQQVQQKTISPEELKIFEARQRASAKELAEWKEAEAFAGKIQSGNPKRYDPRSSVGKKINAYLDNWAMASARKAESGSGAKWTAPTRNVYIDPISGFGSSIASSGTTSTVSEKLFGFQPTPQIVGGFGYSIGPPGKITPDKVNIKSPTTLYTNKQEAIYDPKVGGIIYQSMSPEIMTEQGYQKIDIIGEKGNKYIIESPTGLLTSSQERRKDIIEKYPKSAPLFGVTGHLSSEETPTTFLINKPGVKEDFQPSNYFDTKINKGSTLTTYDFAKSTKPFSETELEVQSYKKNPSAFESSMGYGLTDSGKKIIVGTASPVTPLDLALVVSGGHILRTTAATAYAIPKTTYAVAGANFGAVKIEAYDKSLFAASKIRKFTDIEFKKGSRIENVLDTGLRNTAWTIETGSGIIPRTYSEAVIDTAVGVSLLKVAPWKLGKIPTGKVASTGTLFGFGAYSTYQGFTNTKLSPIERRQMFALGGLGFAGTVPSLVSGKRYIGAKFGEGAVKTKTLDTGIRSTPLNINGEKIDLQYIPGRNFEYKPKSGLLISEKIPWKSEFKLPETTKEQEILLGITKEQEGIVTGSFAQEALVKDSRPFQDLDILLSDPKKFASQVESKHSDIFNVEEKIITDSPLGDFTIYKVYSKKTKQHLADIDPLKMSEEGMAKYWTDSSVDVGGLKLLAPEVRLYSKAVQAGRKLKTEKRGKVSGDVASLLGLSKEAEIPLLRGYGLSKVEQKELFLGSDFYSTHGGIGVIPKRGKSIFIEPGTEGLFYSTPTSTKSKIISTRLTRMGIGSEPEYVSPLELLKPSLWKDISFLPKRKSVVFEKGKLGKDFIQPNIGTSEIEIARVIPEKGTTLNIIKKFKTTIDGERVDIAFTGRTVDKIKSNKNKRNKILFEDKILNEYNRGKIKPDKMIMLPIKVRESPFNDINLFGSRKKSGERKSTITNSIRSIGKSRDSFNTISTRVSTKTRRPTETTSLRVSRMFRETKDTRGTRIFRETKIPTEIRLPRREKSDSIFRSLSKNKKVKVKIKMSNRQDKKSDKITGYIPEAKSKGGKWITLSSKPLSRSSALSRGSRAVDQTLSAQFRVKKSKGKVSQGIDNYFGVTKHKYRPYKVRKGQKVELINHLIEKRGSRIDTQGEKSGLSLAKFAKHRGWLPKAKKKKRSKKNGKAKKKSN